MLNVEPSGERSCQVTIKARTQVGELLVGRAAKVEIVYEIALYLFGRIQSEQVAASLNAVEDYGKESRVTGSSFFSHHDKVASITLILGNRLMLAC